MAQQMKVNYNGSVTMVGILSLAEETISSLKASIIESGSLPLPQECHLLLFYDDTSLDDSRSLYSYDLKVGDELRLEVVEPTMVEVRLERDGRREQDTIKTSVFIKSNKTIADVKDEIFQQCHIPVDRQRIKTLSSSRLGDGVVVYSLINPSSPYIQLKLDVRFMLTLQLYTGNTFQLEVASNERVDTLHAAVNSRVRVPYHHQEITYGERVLEMGQKISDYGVPDEATLLVNLREYEVMVFVRTITGQTILLSVTPRDTVADVKAKIERQEGIPFRKQRLIFVGEQLHDERRFLDYHVEQESAVHLVFREGDTFEVYVCAPSRKSYVFEVDPNDSVDQLKGKLRDKEGIPPAIQRLYHGNELLQSDRSLRDSNITPGAYLRLLVDNNRSTQVFISLPSQDTFPLWVSPDQSVLALKEMIAEKKNIALELQEIYFARVLLQDEKKLRYYTIENNHILHVNVIPPPLLNFTVTLQGNEKPIDYEKAAHQTVIEIKQSLFMVLGVHVDQQQLFLEGSELEDLRKLSECSITNGSNLDLIISPPPPPPGSVMESGTTEDTTTTTSGGILFVRTLTGKTLMVDVEPTNTILSIKEQIKAKEGVAISHQCLVCGGRMLGNDATLSDCGVQNMSTLHLVLRVPSLIPVPVVVKLGEESFEFIIQNGDTVNGLKEEVEVKFGIPPAKQTLVVSGEILDDMEPLTKHDFKEGTIIQVQEN